MKKLIINSLDKGYFGIRDSFVKSGDVEVIHDGQTYIIKKGTMPHKMVKKKSKFGPENDFFIYMYKAPVIAEAKNQMELFK
jgi:hypothetical protein